MPENKRRDYCFTINNYTDADLASLKSLEENAKTRYLIFGKEVGEEGTPHIQGYVYFHNPTAFNRVSKLIPRAFVAVCRGTPEQNIAYCSKDGDVHEYGEKPISQKRKGELGAEYWSAQKKLAIEGKLDEIDPKLFISHYRTLRAIQKDYATMPPDADGVTGEWFYGPTRSGKSRTARDQNPGFYLKMCNRWWDGYNGEDAVIIEDFDKKHGESLGYYLKIWADRYAFPAEIKASKVNIRPKKIIVTSNWSPQQIWSEPESLDPILERFKVTHFNKNLNIA